MPSLKIELESLVEIQFYDSIIKYESFPGSHATVFHLETKRFDVENLQSPGMIVTSRCGPESDVFFQMDFVFNPFETDTLQKIADQSLTMTSGGVDIFVDHHVLSDVQRLFRVPDEANLNEFSAAIEQEYIQRVAQTRAGLGHIISTRNVFLISLDMRAPKITIPGPKNAAETPPNIVLNFGRLLITSNKSAIGSDQFEQSEYTLQELEHLAYANYDMKLDDLEILVGTDQTTTTSHILQPLSISLKFERLDSKAQATVDLPKYRAFGEIVALDLNISNYRLVQIKRIQKYAKTVWTAEEIEGTFTPLGSDTLLPTAPEFISSERVQGRINALANLDQVESVYLFDTTLFAPLAGVESGNDIFFDAQESSISLGSKHSTSCASEAIQLELGMMIHAVTIDMVDEIALGKNRILQVCTGELSFNYKMRKYSNETKGQCASFDVIYEPDQIKDRLNIVEMGDRDGEKENQAVSFIYHEDTHTDLIETDLLVESECFTIVCDPFMLSRVMRYLNSMTLKLDSTFPSPTNSDTNPSSDLVVPSITVTSVATDESATSIPVPPQPVLPTIKNIQIKSTSAQLDMFYKSKPVSQFCMTGTECEICLTKENTIFKLRVNEVVLSDPNASPNYERVIYVEDTGKTFFDLCLTMNNNVDDSSFTKLSSETTGDSHGEFKLRTGAIRINFFYEFMDHLVFHYADDVTNALNTDFDLALLTDFSNSSRYVLDVEIHAPKIFMPESQNSVVGIEADLGFLSITNRFKLYEISSPDLYRQVKIPPIQDRIEVSLKDVKLDRVTQNDVLNFTDRVNIMNQEALNVTIIRNLSCRWFFDHPAMEIKLNLPKMILNLSKLDLEVFWKVLYQNLMGRFSQLQFQPETIIKRGVDSAPARHGVHGTSTVTPTIVRITNPEGVTVPIVSGAQYLTVDNPVSAQTSDINAPPDYELMTVDFEMGEIEIVLFSDSNHNDQLTLTSMVETRGKYTSLKNEEMVVKLSMGNLLLKDLRNINTTHMPVYLVQKQLTEGEILDERLFTLTYSSFPKDESHCAKQIISIKIKSVRAILILDLCAQLNDILVNSMPTAGVDQSGAVHSKPGSQLRETITAERIAIPMTEYSEDGVKSKPVINTTRLQFYMELERPHVLIVTDMTNRSSSVLKVGCNLRLTYIASINDQNLDISLLQTDMACVPFKYSFDSSETAQAGINVLNGVDFDFTVQFSPNATNARVKCSDFEITLTPAVLSTIVLAYQFLMGSTEVSTKELTSSASLNEYIPLHCQQVIKPANIWFLPNPIGSDVDMKSSLSENQPLAPPIEKRHETFDIELPKVTIRFESHMFYERSTSVVFLPLFMIESRIKGSILNWSSEMKADISTQMMVDVYHESRPGYERLLEPVESNYKPLSNDLNWFEVDLVYKVYSQRSQEQHTTTSFADEDDFEHTERLPKAKLIIETKNAFNLNISNETVKVTNHLISSFSESVTDMEKTSSLTNNVSQKNSIEKSKSGEDIRAPITIDNQTGHDVVLITPSHWNDFDPASTEVFSRQSTLSPVRRQNQLAPTNQASFLSFIESGQSDVPAKSMYKLTSNQLYFHIKKKESNHSKWTRAIRKEKKEREIRNEILSIEPAGFTRRQLDVTSQGEIPLEFISNMNPTLKVTLLISVEAIGGTKKIVLKSTFVINNQLPLSLRVAAFGDAKSEFYIPDADQNQTTPSTLPIRCFNQQKSLSIELADFGYQKQTLSYREVTTEKPLEKTLEFGQGADMFFAAVTIKATKFIKSPSQLKFNLTIAPCFVVRNWLPYPITVKFDSDVMDYNVESGRALPVIRSRVNPSLHVSFKTSVVEGEQLYESESIQIPTIPRLSTNRDDISLFKFSRPDAPSRVSYLRKKIVWSQNQARLEVYASAWVINKTGLVLQYYISNQIGKEERIMHLGDVPFMLLPSKQREIAISCDKSAKSEKFNFSAVGSQGTVYCPPDSRSSDLKSYLLGKDITSTTFGLTSVITITSFYHLFNRTESDLEVGEYEATPPGAPAGKIRWILVPAKSKIIFWPRKNAEKMIRVRIPKSTFVSKPITYDVNDQGVLLYMGDVSGIFAEISNTDNECAISFSTYFPGSAAFNIINLTGFPVAYRQKTDTHSSQLLSCNSVLYTWNEPSQQRELYIEIQSEERRSSTLSASTRNMTSNLTIGFPSRTMPRNQGSTSTMSSRFNSVLIPESGKDALTQRELTLTGAIVYVIPIFIGAQRTVIITQDRYHATTLADSDKQVINWDMTLKVKSITVSLIDYVRRREVAVAHIVGTGVTWHQQIKGQKKWRELDDKIAKLAEQSYRSNRQTRFRVGDVTVDTKNMTMVKGLVLYLSGGFI